MDSRDQIMKIIKNGFHMMCKSLRGSSIKAIEAYKSIEVRCMNTAISCQIKFIVAYNEIKPILMQSTLRAFQVLYVGIRYSFRKVESKFGKVHFDFHHFVMTTGSAVMVFALAFTLTGMNRSKVSAAVVEQVVSKETIYNNEAIQINFGDDTPIVNVISDILAQKTGYVNEARPITLHGGNFGYEIGNYIVSLDKVPTRELKKDVITISIQNKDTYNTNSLEQFAFTGDEQTSQVNTFKLNVEYVDKEAPVVMLSESNVEMNDDDPLFVRQYLSSIIDNYDGEIVDYELIHNIPEKDELRWEAGVYPVVFKATDSNGNVGEATLNLTIHETSDESESNTESSDDSGSTGVASYDGANSVYAAAMAQLGTYQDCTMLATNALRSVGIYYHGWPAGYMSLGTVVSASEAQPGDLIYYANGGTGLAHIAVYAGNGMAIHGGWLGNQTVLNTAYVGSGPVFIRITK